MIAFVKGFLVEKAREHIIVDVHGVGYQVRVARRHLLLLPETGHEVQVLTQLVHREDSMELYGFENGQARDLFLALTAVSGIGFKTSLAILSEMAVGDIIQAVVSNQPKKLTQAPGVGLKTAQRVILELREKLMKWHPQADTPTPSGLSAEVLVEVQMTLQALGYSEREIEESMGRQCPGLSPQTDTEEMLRVLLMDLSQL